MDVDPTFDADAAAAGADGCGRPDRTTEESPTTDDTADASMVRLISRARRTREFASAYRDHVLPFVDQ